MLQLQVSWCMYLLILIISRYGKMFIGNEKRLHESGKNIFIMVKKISLSLIFLMAFLGANAQCAMCKAVVENGDSDLAEGLNFGIIYLMIFPYLILIVGAFLFYKNRKKKKKVA